MPHRTTLCYATARHATPCHTVPHCATLCHTVPHHSTLCHGTAQHGTAPMPHPTIPHGYFMATAPQYHAAAIPSHCAAPRGAPHDANGMSHATPHDANGNEPSHSAPRCTTTQHRCTAPHCIAPAPINTVMVARQNNKKDIIKIMLKRKVNLNAQNMKGNTALHFAMQGGYTDLARSPTLPPLRCGPKSLADAESNLTGADRVLRADIDRDLGRCGLSPG